MHTARILIEEQSNLKITSYNNAVYTNATLPTYWTTLSAAWNVVETKDRTVLSPVDPSHAGSGVSYPSTKHQVEIPTHSAKKTAGMQEPAEVENMLCVAYDCATELSGFNTIVDAFDTSTTETTTVGLVVPA